MHMAWCDTAKVVKIGPLDARVLLPWAVAVIPFELWKAAIAAVVTAFFIIASVIKGMEVDMFLRWIRVRFAGVFRPALPSWLTHRPGRSLHQISLVALLGVLALAPTDPARAGFEIIKPMPAAAPSSAAQPTAPGNPVINKAAGVMPGGSIEMPAGISPALRMRLPNYQVKSGSKGGVPALIGLRYLAPRGWSIVLDEGRIGNDLVTWAAGGQWIDAMYRIALANDWLLGIDPEGRRVIVQPAKMRDRDLCHALGDLINPAWEMRFHSASGKYGLCDPVQGGKAAGAQ